MSLDTNYLLNCWMDVRINGTLYYRKLPLPKTPPGVDLHAGVGLGVSYPRLHDSLHGIHFFIFFFAVLTKRPNALSFLRFSK